MDSEAKKKYDRDNTKLIQLKFNKKTDEDILAWLDRQASKQGYIKQLIRNDLGNENRSE